MCTLEGAARETSSARSARLRQRTYDVISDTELRDVRTHFSHYPGNLMTKHRRRWNDIVSSKKQVGVAQPRGLHVDQDFASHRRCDVNVLEIEASTECIKDKCLHLCLPFMTSGLLPTDPTCGLHTEWRPLRRYWPAPLLPECVRPELRRPSSREAEHTRAPGSSQERKARKQTARTLQALTHRLRQSTQLALLTADSVQ